MTAMGLFSTLAFSQMGGQALTVTAVVYAAAFTAGGHYLWHDKGLRVPGGLLIAIAVSMAPLAVYGIQDALRPVGPVRQARHGSGLLRLDQGQLDLHGDSGDRGRRDRAAALSVPVHRRDRRRRALVHVDGHRARGSPASEYADWETRRTVSICFGLGTILLAWMVDCLRRGGDFAFWLHLFGIMTFWGAISFSSGGTPVEKALYCAMNVGLLCSSVYLGRRVYAVFGVIGIAIYLGDLANKVFKDSLLFPFALSLIGVAVIAAGLTFHRHQAGIARVAGRASARRA